MSLLKITNICIHKIFSNKKSRTLIFLGLALCMVVVALIIIGNSKVDEYIYGKRVSDFFKNANNSEKLLNAKSYHTFYDMTVVSNKTTNTYSVEEYYKEPNKFRFNFTSKPQKNFSIIVDGDKIIIQNSNELNVFSVEKHMPDTRNFASIYTILTVYKEFTKSTHTCNCECKIYEKDSKYTMYVNAGSSFDETCIVCSTVKSEDISKLQLELTKEYIPVTYIVYNKNMLETISIVYNNFELNKDIVDEVFKSF